MAKKPIRSPKSSPHVCVDMMPPIDQMEYFSGLAKLEDATNVIVGLDSLAAMFTALPVKIAFVTAKKWANGRTLNVAFMGGTASQKNHVRTVVPQLENYCSIKFKFDVDPGAAEIRVAFDSNQGAYSYIGTDCLGIPKNTPTLNLGWIDAATTLHEALHALGAIHEHSHPLAGIKWNKPAVYAYYAGPPNYWDKATVDNNLFAKYSADITQFSAYDKTSVMHYPISRDHLLDPSQAVGWNRELSATDKLYLGTIYPKIIQPPVPPLPEVFEYRVKLNKDGTNPTIAKV